MIPDEAISVATGSVIASLRALELGWVDTDMPDGVTIDVRDFDLTAAITAALEAVAPYIKAQAIDKAADDADGLGMEEVPVHSLRFRAECYRNIAANLYGGQS